MKNKQKQFGLSLTEVLVVMAIMAILMGISIPAAKQLMNSFESSTGTRHLINAALSNARAIAVREQTYAGVRFQQDTNGHTYVIFIVNDSNVSQGISTQPLKGELDAYGFRAVIGRKPMKLPEQISIPTISIVFSPTGKLTTHNVFVWNKDGVSDDSSNDTIFNTQTNVTNGIGMFVQDSASQPSVQSITITDKDGVVTTEYISPYTGELVMEYRETKP